MKKTVFPVIVFLIISLVVTALIYSPVIVLLMSQFSAKTATEKFIEISGDYETAVEYIEKVIENNPSDSYICLGVDGINDDIVLSLASKDGERLDADEKTEESISNIKKSFAGMDYTLDAIRIENGIISFDSIDGRYSVIYASDGVNPRELFKGEKSYIKNIEDNWYHKVNR